VLYRPIDRSAAGPAPEDVAFIWERLGADMDLVEQLTGVDVRTAWGIAARG